jgi:hypothetical protein
MALRGETVYLKARTPFLNSGFSNVYRCADRAYSLDVARTTWTRSLSGSIV